MGQVSKISTLAERILNLPRLAVLMSCIFECLVPLERKFHVWKGVFEVVLV